jgi:hypothetical protein
MNPLLHNHQEQNSDWKKYGMMMHAYGKIGDNSD